MIKLYASLRQLRPVSLAGLFSSLLFVPAPIQAQAENFLTVLGAWEIIRNAELDDFEKRSDRPGIFSSSTYIRVGKLSQAVEKDGTLSFLLPGKPFSIKAKPRSVKYVSETDYEWIGNTDGGSGTVIILSRQGHISAHISTTAGVYEIHPAPNGLHVFQEIDPREAGNVGCVEPAAVASNPDKNEKHISEPPLTGKENRGKSARMEGCTPITYPTVLVLYTQNALNYAGSTNEIYSRAELSVAQFNASIQNSAINYNAKLHFLGVAPLTSFNETGGVYSDRLAILSNTEAQNLRNQYKADLVVLFTYGAYGPDSRGAAGTTQIENNLSYAVVELWAATSVKTFAHEVGHLFGCRHNDDNSEQPGYAKAYRIENNLFGQDQWTIMATGGNAPYGRNLNFSNPNVSVNGKVTGSSDCNNARRISETYATVAAFRSNPYPPLGVYLTGPLSVATTARQDYEMVYSCGSAPYTFLWETSTDGVNYTYAGGGGDTYFRYYQTAGYYYLRGTVTGNGQTARDFMITEVTIGQDPNARMGSETLAPALPSEDHDFVNAFPNPANRSFKLEYSLDKGEKVSFTIFDKNGRIIYRQAEQWRDAGTYSQDIDADTFPAGTYVCRLLKGSKTEIKRIIINTR